jgi:hypothetical protein
VRSKMKDGITKQETISAFWYKKNLSVEKRDRNPCRQWTDIGWQRRLPNVWHTEHNSRSPLVAPIVDVVACCSVLRASHSDHSAGVRNRPELDGHGRLASEHRRRQQPRRGDEIRRSEVPVRERQWQRRGESV